MKIIIEIISRVIVLSVAGYLSHWSWLKWRACGYEFDKIILTEESNLYFYLLLIGLFFILLIGGNMWSLFQARRTRSRRPATMAEKINKRIRLQRFSNLFMGFCVALIGFMALKYPTTGYRSIAPGAAKFFIVIGTLCGIWGLIRKYDKKYYDDENYYKK